MKKLGVAMVVLGLAMAAPLTSMAFFDAAATTAVVSGGLGGGIRLTAPAKVSRIEGLAQGGQFWKNNAAIKPGFTFAAGVLKPADYTVTLPDEDYDQLVVGTPFTVTVGFDTAKSVQFTFMPTRSSTGTVVLETTGLAFAPAP